MEGIRGQYSEEFKKDTVGHSLTPEKTVVEVTYDLGDLSIVILKDDVSNIAKKEN